MTTKEKAAAFDALANALANQWWDGKWSWFCKTPCGGPMLATKDEAIADLVEWAKRQKPKKLKMVKAC